ncbi:putative trafficking protein particle complex subunit 13-like protein [Lachnellula suecica]|uniref:Putative trafficking protein particle complex subunit 13-like protein n=1 Tax=Lachnellula suecica TaxID=602035 RepID=A0A8T9C1X4_9HELO|nr:putative trafficking protein particle complex subunit 13-like protein [Lachnellula suecica]
MAHPRASTDAAVKEPHSVSLKVLRLSRPSLTPQHPLPSQPASLAYPTSSDLPFILSPLLTLPPAFGSAYVGETFSCTLCANNEQLPGSSAPRAISNVRIDAEMKIPSSAAPTALALTPASSEDEKEGVDLEPGKSLQRIVNFDLKEEGSHVLAVTVTYTETTATSGRVRTFRKLYQFVCKGCMVVRTKSTALGEGGGKWALEAQLENCGEETIVLDSVMLDATEGWRAQGMNGEERQVLMPGDVQQVGFLVDGEGEVADGRVTFGVLGIGWRGTMGNRGFLSTGALGAKVK